MKWWARRHPGGARAEELAAKVLEAGGLRILERNSASRLGEIDLVAEDPGDGTIVFVEVKSRASIEHGRAEEAVDHRKQRTIVRLARAWLGRRSDLGERAVRFDVVAVNGDGEEREIVHYADAFWA